MMNKKLIIISMLSGFIILITCTELKKEMLVSTGAVVNNVTTTSAEASGLIIDLGEGATQYGHCYATSPNVTVSNLKTQLGVPPGTGGFTSELTNLEPETKYYIKAYLTNGNVTVYGKEISFTTLAVSTSPAATSSPATSVTSTTATLNGIVNANGSNTTVTFEYGLNSSYGFTATADQSPVTGSSGTSVSANITGLTAGTIYHFRVKAVNAGGTTNGSDMTFTTSDGSLSPPTATTAAATSVLITTATLNGIVNANGSSTTVTFEYGLNTSYGSIATADQSPVTGSSGTSVSANITGLAASTIYHFRVKAVNAGGTTNGSDMTFTTSDGTLSPPTATTAAATSVLNTEATLNGTVNANGSSTTVTFEYGPNSTYGFTATADQSPVTGSSGTSVSANITGLTAGSIYHFRVKAVNAGGTTNGSDMTFNTLCTAPSVTTEPASNRDLFSATINGTINANNFSTTVTFEYGTDTNYGTTITAAQSPVTGNLNTSVSADITLLTSNTLYHYRVKADNCGGTVYGNDQTFMTLCAAPTASTDTETNLTEYSATFNGTVNANRFSTDVTFEYGTSISYGYEIAATPSPLTSNNNTAVSADVTGLIPNTVYHYRVKANNCGGTVFGNDQKFTTLGLSGPALSGPSQATGPFNLLWVYTWPSSSATDDHYELEWSYDPASGFQVMISYPLEERTTPFTEIIIPEAVDIGKTTYFRVRAKVAGNYTEYSNVIAVSVPYINITVNPALDNTMLYSTTDGSLATTVFSNTDLAIGTNYISIFTTDYNTAASALYFNIDDLIAGRFIQKATLLLYPTSLPTDYGTMYIVNPLSAAWSTDAITYNNTPLFYLSPYALNNPPSSTAIPWEIDITEIAQEWANGSIFNYGVLLRDNNILWPGQANRLSIFSSNETALEVKFQPQLYIEVR